MRTKRLAVLAAALTVTLALAACGGADGGSGSADAGGPKTIGVAMPTRSSARWIADGDDLKKQLEGGGYKVDLQYAEDDIPTQASQIDDLIAEGSDVLIIAPIDGRALTTQLAAAKAGGIPVISYDRLIQDSANVAYYAAFDSVKVGVAQATSLLTGMGLLDESGAATAKAGPLNIELFAGSADDNNAGLFFKGAMSILRPLIDKGTLVVRSKQADFQAVATQRWDPATAGARMAGVLTSTYSGGDRVDGVLSPYDGISIAILGAFRGAGYGTPGLPFPIVTGGDADVSSVKSIIAGEQYSTIYKDTRALAKVTVGMADALLKGKKPKVNDTRTYYNGARVVPAYLLPVQVVTLGNYGPVLVDGGLYTAKDLA